MKNEKWTKIFEEAKFSIRFMCKIEAFNYLAEQDDTYLNFDITFSYLAIHTQDYLKNIFVLKLIFGVHTVNYYNCINCKLVHCHNYCEN